MNKCPFTMFLFALGFAGTFAPTVLAENNATNAFIERMRGSIQDSALGLGERTEGAPGHGYPGKILPYQASEALQENLQRYGLTAGWYVRDAVATNFSERDALDYYNRKNKRAFPDRVSFLLYVPSGVDAQRLDAFGSHVKALDGDFRIGTFPSNSHDAWSSAWREEAVWEWMFSKTADGTPVRGAKAARGAGLVSAAPKPTCTASVKGKDGGSGPERSAVALYDYAPIYQPDPGQAGQAALATLRLALLKPWH